VVVLDCNLSHSPAPDYVRGLGHETTTLAYWEIGVTVPKGE